MLRRVFPVAATVVSLGCAQVLEIDDLVADRDGSSASGTAGGCAGACGTPGCGVCPEPSAIEVPHPEHPYRIDRYEVTIGEYASFLSASVSPAGQDPSCAYNGSFEPGVVSQAVFDAMTAAGYDTTEVEGAVVSCTGWFASQLADFGEAHPATCVDVCDARAYCAWAGKRLCGKIGDDLLDVTQGVTEGRHGDPDQSQWYRACSSAGESLFPYGDTFELGRCVDAGLSPNRVYDVGSKEACIGGYAGLFDMSGNVTEWEDACTRFGNAAPIENCLVRGGAYYESEGEKLSCGFFRDILQSSPTTSVGFRCCSD